MLVLGGDHEGLPKGWKMDFRFRSSKNPLLWG
jgi:hypothetical protein